MSLSKSGVLFSAPLLAIYLHDDTHAVARHLFAERVFKNELIRDLIETSCTLWGWDVTSEANYQLLERQMQATDLGALWNSVQEIPRGEFPLLIVVKKGNKTGVDWCIAKGGSVSRGVTCADEI